MLARFLIYFTMAFVCLLAIGALPRVAGPVTERLRDAFPGVLPETRDITEIRARVVPRLKSALAQEGLRFGAPVYVRIFKEEKLLEVWVEDTERYALFASYPICNHSGDLGPKLKEGDRQSPEGFYDVALGALNPKSSFHLSFNLGFPNAYDRAQARTGSYLMVHGDCVSVGCYAMTDPAIQEIYLLMEGALRAGQASVPVHAFPFRMSDARMEAASGARWYGFWTDLKPAFDQFETTKRPPRIELRNNRYAVLE